jgi:hypothetical protein
MDLHGGPVVFDSLGLLPPLLSFHVYWQKVYTALQEFNLHSSTTGDDEFLIGN